MWHIFCFFVGGMSARQFMYTTSVEDGASLLQPRAIHVHVHFSLMKPEILNLTVYLFKIIVLTSIKLTPVEITKLIPIVNIIFPKPQTL